MQENLTDQNNQTPLVSPETPYLHKSKKIMWISIAGGGVILGIIFSVGLHFLLFRTSKESTTQAVEVQLPAITNTVSLTPTPVPFVDMTIPYLREKKYESSLGVREEVYENEDYTAYLTSYASDGLKVNGLLTIPLGKRPTHGWRAIIFVHGYIPPAQYKTTQNYYDYVDYLARSGFVIFKIDLRGHGDSEGDPGGAYYSSDYIVDVLNAHAALAASDFINPNSIGLWGHSMAGNIVMRSFAVKPTIPAVVIWAGAVYSYIDQREYGINDASYQPPPQDSERVRKRQQIRTEYGEPSEKSTFWQQVAPTNYLNDLKGAIQIHHAINDTVVDIGYSRNLNSILDKASVKHELFEYSSGGHNISGESYTKAMSRTVKFFRENL